MFKILKGLVSSTRATSTLEATDKHDSTPTVTKTHSFPDPCATLMSCGGDPPCTQSSFTLAELCPLSELETAGGFSVFEPAENRPLHPTNVSGNMKPTFDHSWETATSTGVFLVLVYAIALWVGFKEQRRMGTIEVRRSCSWTP